MHFSIFQRYQQNYTELAHVTNKIIVKAVKYFFYRSSSLFYYVDSMDILINHLSSATG